jgi:hypothetical protein
MPTLGVALVQISRLDMRVVSIFMQSFFGKSYPRSLKKITRRYQYSPPRLMMVLLANSAIPIKLLNMVRPIISRSISASRARENLFPTKVLRA